MVAKSLHPVKARLVIHCIRAAALVRKLGLAGVTSNTHTWYAHEIQQEVLADLHYRLAHSNYTSKNECEA